MRFARITQEVILRHKELAVEHEKTGRMGRSALETLFLYTVILLHSWGSGVCDMKFKELCETYGLNLKNSYRRLKILRRKGWIEDTKKHIRPLLIHESKSVIVTPENDSKTVTVTPINVQKSVTVTPEKCNSYTKNSEKSVTVTPKNDETSIPPKDYNDTKTFLNLKSNLETTTTRSSNDNKSQFSAEDCVRWVETRIKNGEKIETPHRLARWAHQTGEMDAFILATLYPEQIQTQQIIVEQQIEYDDNFEHFDARSFAEEWAETLEYLRELGADVSERRSNYAPEIWARLMEALNG